MSRVFRVRNRAGFWRTEVTNPVNLSVRKKKRVVKPGRIVAFADPARRLRRKKQQPHVGLPRDRCASGMVDALTLQHLRNEARRRGLFGGGLVGRLLELIVEDDLFDAILGPVGERKP